MPEASGEMFIHSKYPDLQKSKAVEGSVGHQQMAEGKKIPNSPDKRIEAFLRTMERVFIDDPNHPKGETAQETAKRRQEMFKNNFLYPAVLIDKDGVPDNYLELQIKIARERGQEGDWGGIKTAADIPEETRRQYGETIYSDQKKSLDVWLDYLTSADAKIYPTWFKYFAFRNVIGMGAYDKTKREFGRRSKETTAIFPDLNREALAYAYDVLNQTYIEGKKLEGEELNQVLKSANFAKIYAFAIEKVTPASKENKERVEGEWVKFNQGSDATPLYESLQGHGTGWCTAGEETARSQLEKGDFYVYYTKDERGKKTIPRIAIRMEMGRVAEVRGIGESQNLESKMIDIARDKYEQLPGGDKYEKKDRDMKRLTMIETKFKAGEELTREDLSFVYEIEGEIEGFGYQKDPRIREIISTRDVKDDLSLITGFGREEISLTQNEALKGGIKFHYGDIELPQLTSARGLKLPESIKGSLYLFNLTSAEGLKLPRSIGGDLDLSHLTSAKGLTLPHSVGGYLGLSKLTSAEGLKLPESVGGDLKLSHLTSAKGLKLPESVGGILHLPGLTSAEGLELPRSVGSRLNLSGLTSAKGLKLPESIGGVLSLSGLTSAEGLELPQLLKSGLELSGLTSAKGLKLPESLKHHLNLCGLTSAEGLELPKIVEVEIYLWGMKENDRAVLESKYPGFRFNFG